MDELHTLRAALAAADRLAGLSQSPDLAWGRRPRTKTVSPSSASGGFGAILQFSSACCLRQYASDLAGSAIVGVSRSDLQALAADGQVETIALATALASSWQTETIAVTSEPIDLKFLDPDLVEISFDCYLTLSPAPFDASSRSSFVGREVSELDPGISGGARTSAFAQASNFLGHFMMRATMPYSVSTDGSRQSLCVIAQTGNASFHADQLSGDANLVMDLLVARSLCAALWAPATSPRLTPTIALQGPEFATDSLPFAEFSPVAFDKENGSVLVIAFDLRAGCHGTKDDVQSVIGQNDFAYVADEFTVSVVLRRRWPSALSSYVLPLSQNVRLSDNDGHSIDGTLRGSLDLETLDAVTLTTDSVSGTDCLEISGTSVANAGSILLQDGSTHAPPEIDLGQPVESNWSARTVLALDSEPSADPVLAIFQKELHANAYCYLSRPFAAVDGLTQVNVTAAEIEGVAKYVCFTGLIKSPLS